MIIYWRISFANIVINIYRDNTHKYWTWVKQRKIEELCDEKKLAVFSVD